MSRLYHKETERGAVGCLCCDKKMADQMPLDMLVCVTNLAHRIPSEHAHLES